MEHLLTQLRRDHADIQIQPGKIACWLPSKRTVEYTLPLTKESLWTLCHELSHARLGHASFKSDVDLLQKEVAAWEEALRFTRVYQIEIDEEYMQDCLDSYRHWLHQRSTCPECGARGLQQAQLYKCINCDQAWTVSDSRFCRAYRRSTKKAL